MDHKAQILAGKLVKGMTFSQKVWAMTTRIPKGKVVTYGDIAHALDNPNGARAVGMAMHNNPYAPDVPCHRVVGSCGHITGFASGLENKRKLLASEGVPVENDRVKLSDCRHAF